MSSPLDALQARWPKSDLDYLRSLLATVLLLVVLPLAILHFLARPIDIADHAIKARVAA